MVVVELKLDLGKRSFLVLNPLLGGIKRRLEILTCNTFAEVILRWRHENWMVAQDKTKTDRFLLLKVGFELGRPTCLDLELWTG